MSIESRSAPSLVCRTNNQSLLDHEVFREGMADEKIVKKR